MKYVGDPGLHDGRITDLEHSGSNVVVRVHGGDGGALLLSFGGVLLVEANRPVGMLIYALVEESAQDPHRRFVFANWDEDDEASLTGVAESFESSSDLDEVPDR